MCVCVVVQDLAGATPNRRITYPPTNSTSSTPVVPRLDLSKLTQPHKPKSQPPSLPMQQSQKTPVSAHTHTHTRTHTHKHATLS